MKMNETADTVGQFKENLTEEQFLASYHAGDYEKPSMTVDMLIFTVADEEASNYRRLPGKALKLLLVKRKEHPFLGQWALPGGFVRMNESLDDAARRKLREKTRITDVYMEQLYTWGDVDRDPRTRIISTSYMSLTDSSLLTTDPESNGLEGTWFTLSWQCVSESKKRLDNGSVHQHQYKLDLVNDTNTAGASLLLEKVSTGRNVRFSRTITESHGIAFDHAGIIGYGIERLRSKLDYTDIAFNLMPDLFTLTELQQVYEIIGGSELLKANFRRKITDKVIETNAYEKSAGHRPSKLFRFNPDWNATGE